MRRGFSDRLGWASPYRPLPSPPLPLQNNILYPMAALLMQVGACRCRRWLRGLDGGKIRSRCFFPLLRELCPSNGIGRMRAVQGSDLFLYREHLDANLAMSRSFIFLFCDELRQAFVSDIAKGTECDHFAFNYIFFDFFFFRKSRSENRTAPKLSE